MLNDIASKVSGYKTYILAAVGMAVALTAHFFGPFDIGSIHIPALSWTEVWGILWNGGLFSFLRMGVKKSEIAVTTK